MGTFTKTEEKKETILKLDEGYGKAVCKTEMKLCQ
jgi:hypothetical protein